MMTQLTYTRHRVAILIAFLFIASVMVSMSNMVPTLQKEPTTVEFSDQGHPLGKIDRNKLTRLSPNVVVLPQFNWSGQIDQQNSINMPIVPVLAIKNSDMIARICDLGPNMISTIKQVLGQFLITERTLDSDVLGKAGNIAAERINESLGKLWVKNLYLLQDVTTPVMVAAEGCRLIR